METWNLWGYGLSFAAFNLDTAALRYFKYSCKHKLDLCCCNLSNFLKEIQTKTYIGEN